MIDFSSLNPVQQAAKSMIQSDLRFLYTVIRHINPKKSNYIPSLLPYFGVVVDGAEDWVKAINNSCKCKLPIPHFTRDEEQFYMQIRTSVKLWKQDYDSMASNTCIFLSSDAINFKILSLKIKSKSISL